MKDDVDRKTAAYKHTSSQRESLNRLATTIQSLKTLAQALTSQTNNSVFTQISSELDKRSLSLEADLLVSASYPHKCIRWSVNSS